MAEILALVRAGLSVLGAVTFLVSGVWLCLLRPRSARHAGLGLFLFFSAFVTGFVAIRSQALGSGDLPLSLAARRGQQLATIGADLAVLVFVLHFPRVRGPLRSRRWLSRTTVALAFVLWGLVALWPEIYRRDLLVDGTILEVDGPLIVLVNFPTFIVYAAILVRDYVREPRSGRRRSLLLVSLGLLLYRVPVATFELVLWDPIPIRADELSYWRPLIGAIALAFILITLAIAWRKARVASRGPARLLAATLALAGIGIAAGLRPDVALFGVLFGAGGFLFGLLALYGILRGEILNLDARVNLTIRRSTVAAAILGTFLVVAEIVQSYFSATAGAIVGGAAAGVLLLAAAPLQRAADRLASGVAPSTSVRSLPREERLDLYREAARDAWADGSLGRAERRVLEGLRRSLGLDAEDTARIEAEAAAEAP